MGEERASKKVTECVPRPLPKGITVRYVNEAHSAGNPYRALVRPPRLEISLAWYSLSELAPYMLTLVLYPWLAVRYSGRDALIAGALGFAYPILAVILNRTVLSVDGEEIRIRHAPLPVFWRSRCTVPRRKLHAVRYVHHMVARGDQMQWSHRLVANFDDGTEQVLFYDLPTDEHGRFMEKEVAQWLGLEQRRVR